MGFVGWSILFSWFAVVVAILGFCFVLFVLFCLVYFVLRTNLKLDGYGEEEDLEGLEGEI